MSKHLSQTVLLRAAECLGPMTLRAWIGSLRATTIADDKSLLPANTGNQGVVYAGWHESLLAAAALYGALHPYTLASKSRDGEYIARILSRLGWRVVRGSCRKGEVGLAAAWDIMESLRSHPARHFFLATDGPIGPRRVFKEGAIYLASRTNRPLVLIGVAHERPWRARSWDRFVLPRPFTRMCLTFSDSIESPRHVNRRSIDAFRQHVQERMDDVQLRAERCLADLLGEGSRTVANYGIHPANRNPKAELTHIPQRRFASVSTVSESGVLRAPAHEAA